MRSCTEFEALTSAFIDGDLREEDRGELMAHMAACPACQEYFDDQIAIHDALSGMEETQAPAGLAGGVMARIRAEKKPERKVLQFPQWKRFAAMAACCAVVLLGVWAAGMEHLAPVARTDGAAPRTAMDMAADDAAVYSDAAEPGLAPQNAVPEEAKAEPELTVLPGAADCAGGSAVTAKGPAARAWVEEALGLPWAPGEKYELTEEQYAELLTTLEEAEEEYSRSPAGEGLWVIME